MSLGLTLSGSFNMKVGIKMVYLLSLNPISSFVSNYFCNIKPKTSALELGKYTKRFLKQS